MSEADKPSKVRNKYLAGKIVGICIIIVGIILIIVGIAILSILHMHTPYFMIVAIYFPVCIGLGVPLIIIGFIILGYTISKAKRLAKEKI